MAGTLSVASSGSVNPRVWASSYEFAILHSIRRARCRGGSWGHTTIQPTTDIDVMLGLTIGSLLALTLAPPGSSFNTSSERRGAIALVLRCARPAWAPMQTGSTVIGDLARPQLASARRTGCAGAVSHIGDVLRFRRRPPAYEHIGAACLLSLAMLDTSKNSG